MLHRNCLTQHYVDGKIAERIEVAGRRGRRRKQLLMNLRKDRVLETEIRSTRSQSVKNSHWKRLCTYSKTDYGVNDGGSFLILY